VGFIEKDSTEQYKEKASFQRKTICRET